MHQRSPGQYCSNCLLPFAVDCIESHLAHVGYGDQFRMGTSQCMFDVRLSPSETNYPVLKTLCLLLHIDVPLLWIYRQDIACLAQVVPEYYFRLGLRTQLQIGVKVSCI